MKEERMRVSAVQQACDSCRVRKMRCTKEYPVCLKCKEHNWKCVYSPRKIRSPLTREYVSKVERRAENLENLLKRILPNDVEINDLLRMADEESKLNDFDKSNNEITNIFKHVNLTSDELSNITINLKNIDLMSRKKEKEDELFKKVEYQPEDYLINIKQRDLNFYDERTERIQNSKVIYDSSIDGMAALSNDTGLSFDSPNSNGYFGINSSNGLLKFLKIKSERNGNGILELNLKPGAEHNLEEEEDIEDDYVLDEEVSNIWKNIDSGKIDDFLDNFDFQAVLIDSFFENYYKVYPLINKENFYSKYSNYIKNYGMPLEYISEAFSLDNDLISFQVLLNTILALGAWCKLGDNPSLHNYYYQRIKVLIQNLDIFEYSDIQLLESFVLLSNYVQKTNKPNTGWSYLGISTRIATSLGLHKEVKFDYENYPSSNNLKVFKGIESRKRLWWGMYYFDVGSTLTFGRPLTIPPLSTIDLESVYNIDDNLIQEGKTFQDIIVDYPTIYTSLIYESNLTKISTRIYNYNSAVLKLSNDKSKMIGLLEMNDLLDKFIGDLPLYFNENNDIARHNLMTCWAGVRGYEITGAIPMWFAVSRLRLTCRYKNLKLLIFRYILWESVNENMEDRQYQNLVHKCQRICLNSSIETIIFVDAFVKENTLTYLSSWYATYFLFQAALIPILIILINNNDTSSKEMAQALPLLNKNEELLRYIEIAKQNFNLLKRYNKLAGKFNKLIDLLLGGKKEVSDFNWQWFEQDNGFDFFGGNQPNFEATFLDF